MRICPQTDCEQEKQVEVYYTSTKSSKHWAAKTLSYTQTHERITANPALYLTCGTI